MHITVHCDEDLGKLDHFWCSTGFSPAELLLTPDMRQALVDEMSVNDALPGNENGLIGMWRNGTWVTRLGGADEKSCYKR